ncbi:ABC transporter ATP-binding protein [Nonomuraea sp. NPDC050556]|uniref:ABC transporter ATP-binding protein n=1 Tax=Nonomuraea sp. NPDC050556 TaxID=3364369 RepID=UPI0037B5F7B5
MLAVEGLEVRYGAVSAVSGVSLELAEGATSAVLGANGAGKTSLIKALMGWEKAASGRILFGGVDVTTWTPWRRARAGMAVVPERGRVYGDLTIEENLVMGAFPRRPSRKEMLEVLERFPGMGERLREPARLLSGGQQQMIAIARALMARPRLLLVDEVTSGLAPLLVAQVFATLGDLAATGLTLLVAEQNARRALEITSRAIVLQRGRIALSGESAQLRAEPRLLDAYLGSA